MGEKKLEITDKMLQDRLKHFADMLAKQPREFMTFSEFREKVCDWSDDTLMRRIKFEDFPAIKDKGGWLIPREEAKLWFKKRPVK